MALLRVNRTGPAECTVCAGETLIAEVRALQLTHLVLHPGGVSVIDPHVPLPLYWQQYANHQHPERNASSHSSLHVVREEGEEVTFVCEGDTSSGELLSRFTVSVRSADGGTIRLAARAECRVAEGKQWHVTPNPQHGELEFCNFWPAGSFVTSPEVSRFYPAVYVRRQGGVHRIPHHHLESRDKRDIALSPGDAFGWFGQSRNLRLDLSSGSAVVAGVCAYMWDVHLGVKVCHGRSNLFLPSGYKAEATFSISVVSDEEAASWLSASSSVHTPELLQTPLVIHGCNTFRETLEEFPGEEHRMWPWVFECLSDPAGGTVGVLDTAVGFDDDRSLRISGSRGSEAQWKATTLGPAFGGPPFLRGAVYRLSAMVRTQGSGCTAMVAIRIHRAGADNLFDISRYEVHRSKDSAAGDQDWRMLSVETPPLTPEPDRMHLLLLHRGEGQSWFDNVTIEEIHGNPQKN